MRLGYTFLIATRNRPEALRCSLPLMLRQTVLADEIIISDSSDDPSENREIVALLGKNTSIPITHVSAPIGGAIQRNIGLDMVTSPIVAMPDDDSLLRADAMERIMAVYERDTEEKIGGVGGYELSNPDQGMLPESAPIWDLSKTEISRKKFLKARNYWEKTVVPCPLKLRGQRLIKERGVPKWLASLNTVPVEWLTGFRMTYRTDIARRLRFSEELGKYALYEDIDISLRVLREKLVVACLDAGIYHHRWPSNRANGVAIGAMHVLNRAYVLKKSGNVAPKEIRAMWRWATARLAVEVLRAKDDFGKERRNGTYAAYRCLRSILNASDANLTATYLQQRAAIFSTEGERE